MSCITDCLSGCWNWLTSCRWCCKEKTRVAPLREIAVIQMDPITLRDGVFASPHCFERIYSFLPLETRNAIPSVSKGLRSCVILFANPAVRFPFSKVLYVESAQLVFERVHRHPAYLREADDANGLTPAMRAFTRKKFHSYRLAEFYLSRGGQLALNPSQKLLLSNSVTLQLEHPRLSYQIREARWEATKNSREKEECLQETLNDACHKGNLAAVKWVIKKCNESKRPFFLSLEGALNGALSGGFEHLLPTLFRFIPPEMLDTSTKIDYVTSCVTLGYHHLLPILKSYGFPVSEVRESQMKVLAELEARLEPLIHFPMPINPMHDKAHGGSDSLKTSNPEYKKMVAYVVAWLYGGHSIVDLIENLCHRRRRMAVLAGLSPLDDYGKPTNSGTETPYSDSTYESFGKTVHDRFELPHQVSIIIDGQTIPLTIFDKKKWKHPNGTHRDTILREVDRIVRENLRPPKSQETFEKAIADVIFLISHAPIALRGTPIILRAIIDGIYLFLKHHSIDPRVDINCEALTHDNVVRFLQEIAPHLRTPPLE